MLPVQEIMICKIRLQNNLFSLMIVFGQPTKNDIETKPTLIKAYHERFLEQSLCQV